jgi:hypothetical protein
MQLPNDRLDLDLDNPSVLPVVVWGTGTDGALFREQASAKDLTLCGAVLTGILHPVAPGDLVGVQYQQHKAHARVTRTSQADNQNQWLLWVQLLEKSRCPWAGVAQALVSATAAASQLSTPRERRGSPRHPVSVPLHLHRTLDCPPTFFNTKDISESGCYIETIFPLPKESDLSISLELGSDLVSCNGLVRTCDPNVGMGIEFIGLDEVAKHLLSRYIRDHSEDDSSTTTIH